jgi:ABC-type transporter Mla MlaB component
LLATRVLPLAIRSQAARFTSASQGGLRVSVEHGFGSALVTLTGRASRHEIGAAIAGFREALTDADEVVVDLSGVSAVDQRFLGLLQMVRKRLGARGVLKVVGASSSVARSFRLNAVAYLLSREADLGIAPARDPRPATMLGESESAPLALTARRHSLAASLLGHILPRRPV